MEDVTGIEPSSHPDLRPTSIKNDTPAAYVSDTQRLIAYTIVLAVAVFISFFIIYPYLEEYMVYSSNTGFINPAFMAVGTLLSALSVVLICYTSRSPGVLLGVVLYCVSIIAIYANLRVRVNLYNDGVIHDGRGSIFVVLSIVSILLVMWNIKDRGVYVLLFPLVWSLLLLYQWWYY